MSVRSGRWGGARVVLIVAFLTLTFISALSPAWAADCTDPVRPEGTIGYNTTHHVMQYCNGTEWVAYHALPGGGGGSAGCAAPTSCPDVGDVCSDGSLFAGFLAADDGSCRAIFVTDTNQSTSSQWKTANGTNDIIDPTDKNDAVDGQYNRDNRGSGTFPAFELCENNTYHGKNDWYLPARAEFNLLWLNQAAIDANAAGNFTTSTFWSSTEVSTSSYAWYQYFGFGDQNGNPKTTIYAVRCVRSEDATTGSSGGGSGPFATCGGAPADCTNIGDVCTDGTVFAGCHPHPALSDQRLFLHPNNQSSSEDWNQAGSEANSGIDDSVAAANYDGRANQTWIEANRAVNATNYDAFYLCKQLNDSSSQGHTDWYLPSRIELYYLWSVQDDINNASLGGDDFIATIYWSSTEYIGTSAWYQSFSFGTQSFATKATGYDVRCLRRD
ncbi:MAG: DUF1566 domain-containing protein [Rhodospirillaceae bacterium]|nr:DUF1566 domain-containing protein [Rhodospirillaceae bacterium]